MGTLARISIGLAVVALWTAPLQAQATWTVDDNGGADFVFIQDAVDAAQPDDVILVEAGAYPGFTVDGKPLTIAPASDGAVIQVSSFLEVRNIPLGSQLDLTGLRLGEPFTIGGAPAATIENCLGTVRLTDCTAQGWDPIRNGCPEYDYYGCEYYPCLDPVAQTGVWCTSSAEVVFVRCTFRGGTGSSHVHNGGDVCGYTTPGASGAAVSATFVSLLECTLQGGGGGNVDGSHCLDGDPGGHGVRLSNGSVLFSDRSTLHGGGGGYGACEFFPTPCCGSSGASGFSISADASSAGTHKDTTLSMFHPLGGAGAGAVQETFIAPYCLGTFEECPCGNAGIGTAGCENAHATGGVLLSGSGTPSVSADTVTLNAIGLNPNASPAGLFFQGTVRNNAGLGTVFNDGLLCTGGEITRLKGKAASAGTLSFGYGNPSDQPVSVRGALPPTGGTRFYQVWYRSQPAMFCPPSQFNMSNGLEIVWAP